MTRKRQDYQPPFLSFDGVQKTDAMMRARTAILMAIRSIPKDVGADCTGPRPNVNFMAWEAAQRRLAEHYVMSILVHCDLSPKVTKPGHPD